VELIRILTWIAAKHLVVPPLLCNITRGLKLVFRIILPKIDDSDVEGDPGLGTSPYYLTNKTENQKQLEIQDETNTNLVNLRRTIYLTIMSSVDYEECCHKLMKIDIQEGQEMELVNMIIECSSQDRTFSRFYSLICEHFCNLNRNWQESFEQAFNKYYTTIHHSETNHLRNIAKFFGYLIFSDAIGAHCFSIIHLTEDETTSSSRIFVKIMFQGLQEHLELKKFTERLTDGYLQDSFDGILPRMNPKDIRFSINYLTSIRLGGVTEDMHTALANLPKPAPAIAAKEEDESDIESVSSSGSSRSSYLSQSGSYSGSYSGSESGSDSVVYSERRQSRSRSRLGSPHYSLDDRSLTPEKSPRRVRNSAQSRHRVDSPRRRYSFDASPPRHTPSPQPTRDISLP
jgi:pre-mRNA-splicing factor CWC22